MKELERKVKAVIRDVHDFPSKGIVFKDITTLLANPYLNAEVLSQFQEKAKGLNPDVVIGIDSRGFLFGNTIALGLKVPFVPVKNRVNYLMRLLLFRMT